MVVLIILLKVIPMDVLMVGVLMILPMVIPMILLMGILRGSAGCYSDGFCWLLFRSFISRILIPSYCQLLS